MREEKNRALENRLLWVRFPIKMAQGPLKETAKFVLLFFLVPKGVNLAW